MVHIGITATLLAAIPVTVDQHVCAARSDILSSLSQEYDEAPKAIGLANNGTVIELVTTGDGRTWTLLMTRPDGTSCVVAAGEAWEALPPQVAGGQPF